MCDTFSIPISIDEVKIESARRWSIRSRGCKFRIIELTEIPAPSRKLMRRTPGDTADTPMYELSRQQLS